MADQHVGCLLAVVLATLKIEQHIGCVVGTFGDGIPVDFASWCGNTTHGSRHQCSSTSSWSSDVFPSKK